MGVFIKNADAKLTQKIVGISFTQKELILVLGEIWNNQDNLTKEDKQLLFKLSNKGWHESVK
jgi:hypothetical protein